MLLVNVGRINITTASPVRCSEPLVENGYISANATGAVIVLVNWAKGPVDGLRVTLRSPPQFHVASLATGGTVSTAFNIDRSEAVFTLHSTLEEADAIILR